MLFHIHHYRPRFFLTWSLSITFRLFSSWMCYVNNSTALERVGAQLDLHVRLRLVIQVKDSHLTMPSNIEM